MRKRIAYSQNFLKNKSLIVDLIDRSSIGKNDIVFDIGAGSGAITEGLQKRCKKVIAFEIDKNLASKLNQRFGEKDNFELQGDFMSFILPTYPYKVFSNIPFNKTSGIIKNLTLYDNPPEDCYLIVQKEAAAKFMGKPLNRQNSLMSVILHPWFELSIKHEFQRSDFYPKPGVDVVLLEIKKRDKPLVKNRDEYEDFVTYAFNQTKPNISEGLSGVLNRQVFSQLSKENGFPSSAKPSELDFKHWISIFERYQVSDKKSKVKDAFFKLLKQQEKIDKIYRTRTDRDWKTRGKTTQP